MHMHAHLRMRLTRAYVMALQAWVAAKRTRDFDEADRIREAMLAAGMRRLSKTRGPCGVAGQRGSIGSARGWP